MPEGIITDQRSGITKLGGGEGEGDIVSLLACTRYDDG